MPVGNKVKSCKEGKERVKISTEPDKFKCRRSS